MAQTSVIFHPKYLEKTAIEDFHDRLKRLMALLEENKVVDGESIVIESDFKPITRQMALEMGHTETLLKDIEKTEFLEPALWNCGGAIKAIDNIMTKKSVNAFTTMPVGGHHAGPATHWGFCYLNEIACAVHHLRKKYGLRKVLYIDQDHHHGDGTERFFHNDPDFYFIDFHGQKSGEQPGVKIEKQLHNIDVAMPKGIGGGEYASIVKEVLDFAINRRKFTPDLIINYAGYDSHIDDGFNRGQLRLDYHTFAELTNVYLRLSEHLCEGRLLCISGGGYAAKKPEVAPICAYNTIMILAKKWDNVLKKDESLQESDMIAKIKTNSILKDIMRFSI
jgi:acetoin utilization deacetylase AcuC-like enzyme